MTYTPSRLFALLVAVCAALAMSSAMPDSASAKTIKCSKKQVSIPDDRPGGGNLCMSKKQWKKAKKICKANGSSDPMSCVCQDGGSVSACGN